MQSLSIIIPAFNEEKRLGATLLEIARGVESGVFRGLTLGEVIVSDDGSTDCTLRIAQEWKNNLPMRTVCLPKNRGKGAAVRAGMLAATGDLLLMYDADGATPVSEIPKLLAAIRTGAHIAIGSRVTGRAEGLQSMAPHRRFIGNVYRMLCAALIPGITDAACGCKLFRATAAKKLFALQRVDRFAFDIEVLALALRSGMTVREIPVKWTAMPESKVRLLRDGPEMFLCLIRLYLGGVKISP